MLCEFEIDADARFHGEQGDLQELLGNLLENAFKWAQSRVLLTAQRRRERSRTAAPAWCSRSRTTAPASPRTASPHLLQRGVRGDERVQGHGIGLAIVQDIVRSYRGELDVGASQELGGARFEVNLPPGL